MESREIKATAAELNDSALENVSGGLHTIIIGDYLDMYAHFTCVNCQVEHSVLKEHLNKKLINGQFYCDECKAMLGLG